MNDPELRALFPSENDLVWGTSPKMTPVHQRRTFVGGDFLPWTDRTTPVLSAICTRCGDGTLRQIEIKAALNMLMKVFSARHPGDPCALLLVAPGWVRTEMGDDEATLEISDSIPLVVDMVERNAGVGGFALPIVTVKSCPGELRGGHGARREQTGGSLTRASDAHLVRWGITDWTKAPPLFPLGPPQRNRNELVETTVNKTRRKELPQREKTTT